MTRNTRYFCAGAARAVRYVARPARAIRFILPAVLAACDSIEMPDFFAAPATPHAAYQHSLEQAGLLETALGREWLGAAGVALRAPVRVTLPIEEVGYLAPETPRALAFQVNLVRGRRLVLNAELTPAPGALLFMDVYAVPQVAGDSLRHVAAADSGSRQLHFEPRRTGDYIIRLQPELLRGGRYRLTVRAEPALAFPVHGVPNSAIQSGFGAPRDGGARDHHGIDIFAPRGTPALAATAGVVTRVQETPRGGRVVWLRDERRGANLYYAHLDRQLVQPGDQVQIGDTIGLIGNTGNARTTPPHLHFGVYQRGPQDPRPWVARVNARAAPLRGDPALLGNWARTLRTTSLRSMPGDTTGARALASETMVRVLGAQGNWYQVQTLDGTIGFVAARDAGSARTPLRSRTVAGPVVLQASPGGVVIDTVPAAELRIYGRSDTALYVGAGELTGWVTITDRMP